MSAAHLRETLGEHKWRILIVSYALAVLALSVTIVYLLSAAWQTQRAMCSIQADYLRRAEETRQFVRDGGSIPGFSNAELLRSARNLERTATLINSEVDC